MKYPKIKSAKPLEDYNIIVEFSDDTVKKYDVSHLLNNDMFKPLADYNIFNAMNIEKGGYAVSWNNQIDISEYELWKNGIEI